MSRAYFISDLHLRDENESNSHKLLLFLHSLAERNDVSHFFMVGDIFDLWIHGHRYFVEKFQKIVNAIRVLVGNGVEVHYFEGNHDLYLFEFWQQEVGVRVHDGPEFFQIDNHTIRLEHGDFMNPDDKAYLFLRAFLRTSPLKLIAKNLPGSTVHWLGDRASRASRHYTSNQKQVSETFIRSFMHQYAESVVQEKTFDFLITGHTHVEDIYNFSHQSKKIQFINLGSWFETQRVLIFHKGIMEFEDLPALAAT